MNIPKSELKFNQVSPSEVRVNNVLIGRKRVSYFAFNEVKYSVSFLKSFEKFTPKMNFVLDFDGNQVVVAVDQAIDMTCFDERFVDIDMPAVAEDNVRLQLAKCAMQRFLSTLSAACGVQIFLKAVNFSDKYEHLDSELGIAISNAQTRNVMLCNLSAPDEEFEKILTLIEGIKPLRMSSICDSLMIDFSVEVGSSEISRDEFQNLTDHGIIFLDKCADIQNGIYRVHGLDPLEVECKYENNHFSVVNVQ